MEVIRVFGTTGPRGPYEDTFGIQTRNSPGGSRASLEDIRDQLAYLADYAREYKNQYFMLTNIGTGKGGYSLREMSIVFDDIIFPKNVYISAKMMYQIEDDQFGNINVIDAPQGEQPQLGLW
jgi:hypothetical protein